MSKIKGCESQEIDFELDSIKCEIDYEIENNPCIIDPITFMDALRHNIDNFIKENYRD